LSLFDYLLIAIAGLSMVLSLWRGFVREIISLIGLVAAFFAASRASGMAANLMNGWIPNTTVANIAGFTLVFIAVMVVVALIGALIRRLVDMADLTATVHWVCSSALPGDCCSSDCFFSSILPMPNRTNHG